MREPAIKIPESVEIPIARRIERPNGTSLHILDNGGQGVVRLSFVFEAGSSHQSVPFAAGATLNLLSCGTRNFSAEQIAERLDFYGAYYDASLDRDYAVVTLCALCSHATEIMEIASETILHPTFPEHELATYRAKRKSALRSDRLKPDFIARELFGRTLFGADHPYGRTNDEACYDLLRRCDVEEFYRNHYVADGAFAVISGQSDRTIIEAAEKILDSLPSRPICRVEMPLPHSTLSSEQSIEGAVQSSVRVGKVLFPRQSPDFIEMQVVSTVLGGYFGSRLMQSLRERKGYTYGAYAATINLQHSGYFVAGAEVGREHCREAVDEILSAIELLCRRGVGRNEMEMVRRMLFGEVMRILDGPFGIADITIENIENGTDNHYTEEFVRRIRNITGDEVQAAARRHLAEGGFSVITVG
ncbi:MAG: pitrilysin family protein [Tidjanibacter sp.]|nr:pitrilysin family protein [Tidjanibacter sp.]